MSFRAVINSEVLGDVLGVLSNTVDEARFLISPSGIEVRSVDAANVLLTGLTLPNDAFEFYESDEGIIGIDILKLKDMISSGEKEDNVTLVLADGKLIVSLSSLEWSLGLYSPEAIRKEPRLPEIDLPVSVTLTGKDFKRLIKASKKESDHIRFKVDDTVFTTSAQGDDKQCGVTSRYEAHDLLEIKPGLANSLFSLDYLEDISKAVKAGDAVKLEMGINYPIRISYNATHSEKQVVVVTYLMAPRVEAE